MESLNLQNWSTFLTEVQCLPSPHPSRECFEHFTAVPTDLPDTISGSGYSRSFSYWCVICTQKRVLMSGLSNSRSYKVNPLQGHLSIFEIVAEPWQFLTGNQSSLPSSNPTTPSPSVQKLIGLHKCVIKSCANAYCLRTACLHVFLATQWYRLHWYCFKKSLVETEIEKTTPGNLSEHSVVSMRMWRHRRTFAQDSGLTPHIQTSMTKNNSVLAWRKKIHK